MAEADPDQDQDADKTPSTEDANTSLQTSMKIGKLIFIVTFNEAGLSWVKRGKSTEKAVTIPRDEIISVSTITGWKGKRSEVIGFTVCCIRHMKKCILKRELVQFLCDAEDATKWRERIQLAINQVQSRPKHLLVVINPESGSRSGEKVYYNKVAPLFKQANIETEVIALRHNLPFNLARPVDPFISVTERAHQCEEVMDSCGLTSIDGIVLVGGDGFYHEAVNGLQRRLAREQGLDYKDPNIGFARIPVPIGLIPAGTGNGIAVGCYGCNDVETAALSIIKGVTVEGNLLGVYSQGEFIGVAGLLVGYGVWGDLIQAAEADRAAGRLRYAKAILSKIVFKRHRQMNLTCEHRVSTNKSQKQGQPQAELDIQNENGSQVVSKTEINSQPEQRDRDSSQPEPNPVDYSHDESKLQLKPYSEVQSQGTNLSKTNTEENPSSEPNKEDFETNQPSTSNDIDPSGLENPGFDAEHNQLKSDKNINEPEQETAWKTIKGVYTGAMTFVGDYWSHKDRDTETENCTRLILNNPSGGFKLALLLVKIMTRHTEALNSNLTEDMQIKEAKITVNSPSDEGTETGKLERIINLDGEIFNLQQPEFHVVFHPKTVQLFGAPRESWCSAFE